MSKLPSGLVLIFLLVAIAVLSVEVHSQMTFSDGWVKRSPAPAAGKKLASYVALDVCHAAYTRSVAQLQKEISELYEMHQNCQEKALHAMRNY